MPASDHTTFSYLSGLLAAGARSFPYSGGVYRLLGQTAPQGTAVRFPPPLPPVGFAYEQGPRLWETPGMGNPPFPGVAPSRVPVDAGKEAERGDGEASHRPRSIPPIRAGMRPETGRPEEPPSVPSPLVPSTSAPSTLRPAVAGGRVEAEPSSLAPPRGAPAGEPRVKPRSAEPTAEPGLLGEEPRDVTQRAVSPLVDAPVEGVGLSIPGLSQRRLAFAALAGTLPRSDARSRPDESTQSELPADISPPLPALHALPSIPGEAATFRARARSIEEVEHVRRAVVAQAPQRTGQKAIREAVREAAREAVREGISSARPEGSPRLAASVPVVVVQRVSDPSRQVPRAFWSSSALRSTHLRMLR